MTSVGKKKLIYPLAALIVLILGGLAAYMSINRLLTAPIAIENIKVDGDAALKLGLMNQVSKKNGKTEWELTAASATLLKSEDKVVLEDMSVTFHAENETLVHLTSHKGSLGTKTHDLTCSENVIVQYKGYTLKSDKLQYNKKLHIIRSDSRVLLEDGLSKIEGDTMVTELNQNRIVLNGNVKGTFSEKFDLP